MKEEEAATQMSQAPPAGVPGPTGGAAAVDVHQWKQKWSCCAAVNFMLDEVAEFTEERGTM